MLDEAKTQEPEKIIQRHMIQQSSNLTTFDCFASVELGNGKIASYHVNFQRGMSAEEFMNEFGQFYKALDLLTQNYPVTVWAGGRQPEPSKPENPPAPAAPGTPSGSGGSGGSGGSNGNNSHAPEFKCGNLDVEFKGKGQERKAYYSISGPEGAKFPVFPVRVWPEVLEDAGIVTAEIDPVKGMPLIGWVATYEKEDGKIKKVIKLSKPDFAQ